jgi:peptidoglycan/xylan/chitin deacetylase (PgdA/CDA1 family)
MNAAHQIWKIPVSFPYNKEIEWVIGVFASYAGLQIKVVEEVLENSVLITDKGIIVTLDPSWFDRIYSGDKNYLNWPDENLNLCDNSGQTDYFASVFYFLNCLWEEDPDARKDHWGRSEFDGSIWKRRGLRRPSLKVNELFDQLADELQIEIVKRKSTVFLSHDIDVVSRAHLEDGLYRLRKGQLSKFLRVLIDNLKERQWFNFERIADLEESFDYRSSFFWIPVKGRVSGVGKNADYRLADKKVRSAINQLRDRGFSHGIHKSIASNTLKKELDLLGMEVKANRYHYLKFNFTELIGELNESGLPLDASLGYAQVMGYRNGYSLPFRPFDRRTREVAGFIEVPLTIMDGTFSKYLKLPADQAYEHIITYLQEISENAVISVLWHNSHFTDHKYEGYPDLYVKLLTYFREKGYTCETVDSLISRWG